MYKKNTDNFLNKILTLDLDNLSLTKLLGLKIEYLYLISPYSQLDFSIMINTNIAYFNSIINGTKSITIKKLEQICFSLKMNLKNFWIFQFFMKSKTKKNLYINQKN